MTIKDVLIMGEELLLERAREVSKFDTSELHALLEDMHDTMIAEGGIGIAAPQIGVSQRVMIFGVEHSDRYPDMEPVPYTILINPEYEVLSDEMISDWEGCLSVPGLRGLVPRYEKIKYTGFDEMGKKIERTVEGMHARIIQHEVDHLDGILFPQRIKDMTKFGFDSVLLQKIYKGTDQGE